ncbi:MAG TPA: DUF2442 domain-containing protein [Candidatus Merdivicinus faecavium]|nr:DUF2442 domain-containing protein [Candidatus Merdivicinus faecavium]
MYIVDGIAYAGDPAPMMKVCGVRPLSGYRLWLRFNNEEVKIYDCTPLLNKSVFRPLADESVFRSVYLDYGVPVWNGGEIDIAPEELYEKGIPAESE